MQVMNEALILPLSCWAGHCPVAASFASAPAKGSSKMFICISRISLLLPLAYIVCWLRHASVLVF